MSQTKEPCRDRGKPCVALVLEFMDTKGHIFQIRYLTASKELGMRRIKGFATSIGGHFELYRDPSLFMASFESRNTSFNNENNPKIVSLVDSSVNLSRHDVEFLMTHSILVAIADLPNWRTSQFSPNNILWDYDYIFLVNEKDFWQSPVARIGLAQICQLNKPIEPEKWLRWGFTRHTDQNGSSYKDYLRKLAPPYRIKDALRRFSSFFEKEIVTFGLETKKFHVLSDGLTFCLAAECEPVQSPDFRIDFISQHSLLSSLRKLSFNCMLINEKGDGNYDIAIFLQLEEIKNHYKKMKERLPGELILIFKPPKALALIEKKECG